MMVKHLADSLAAQTVAQWECLKAGHLADELGRMMVDSRVAQLVE